MKKISPFLVGIFMLFSCAEDKSHKIVFSVREMNPQDFSACENRPCPEVNIGFLVAEGKGAVPEKINQQLEKERIKIISTSPDRPSPSSFDGAVKNFITEYQDFRKDFPKFPASYEVVLAEEIAHQSEEIVVIKTEHYLFTGGAHGYGATNFTTFSLENGRLLQAADLFTNLPAFTKYAEEKFREKYKIPSNENINSTGFFFENDVFYLPNNLAVLANEVVLIYQPYEAAAYARGEMVLRFPKQEVEQWLDVE